MLYANGIGPVKKKKNRKMAAKILNKADVITLRDENSLKEAESMGVTVQKFVTADPALSMNGVNSKNAMNLLKEEGIPQNEKLLGISVREWKECDDTFWTSFTNQTDEICQKYGLTPMFIPLKKPEDEEFSCKLQEKLKTKSYVLKNTYTSEEIVGIFGVCELIIGMRLHSLIYASAVTTPAIGISYDPKVSGFVDYIKTCQSLELDEIKEGKLTITTDNIMDDYDTVKQKLKEKNEFFIEKTKETAKTAMKFIKQQ